VGFLLKMRVHLPFCCLLAAFKLQHLPVGNSFSIASVDTGFQRDLFQKIRHGHAGLILSASAADDDDDDQTGGHQVRGKAPDLPPDVLEELQKKAKAFMGHQNKAAKLDFATEVRTLVQNGHGYAVMSTNSKSMEGYPSGSVVATVPDKDGNPLFLFSSMSSHTTDLLEDPKCSLTVASKEFKGSADGRVNLLGTATKLPEEYIPGAKEAYLQKHPNAAIWVDFGDFTWFRMEVENIRFVGGFARAGNVKASDYRATSPDPIYPLSAPVAGHMNQDHSSATLAMVKSVPGLEDAELKAAEILSLDSFGMYVKVTREPNTMSFQPEQFKVRLPFPRTAESRGDIKTLIVEMTQAAAAATVPKKETEKKEEATKRETK